MEYNAADVDDILDIHKYLMKKQDNIWIYLKNVYTAIGYIELNGYNAVNALNTLKCVSMSNQECKVKTSMVNIKSNQSLFYSVL